MEADEPENREEHIQVGDIQDSNAIAIGTGASVTYHQGLSLDEVATLVVELKNQDQPTVWDGRTPYLGLTSFQESDAEFFFGRESLVDDLLERVEQANFITIAGPSGSGKSSVARAGLFHALRSGRLTKSDTWLLATMQPKGDPIQQMALALERATKSSQVGDAIRADGASNPAMLSRQIEMHLTDDPRQRCVILVDQFEETFTQTKNEETRAAFINLLTAAAQAEAGRIVVLLSLRSDFISHCARYPDLRRLMSQQFQLVGAMAPPDLAKAITLPALEVGAEIDPALVSRIMADMKGEPGALPLMSFALRDLFEAEKSAKGQPMDLTLPEYLDRGGIESALERHANKVFDDFSEEQKALARGVFSKLIEVGQGRADTRRTATFQELVPVGTNEDAVEAVVIALAQEDVRLITTDGATSGETITHEAISHATVTIAHEKLIDAWPWLRHLVDENREMIALQNQINNDARVWKEAWKMEEKENKNRDGSNGFLYRGGRLMQVEERLLEANPSLDAVSQTFIQASLDQRQKETEEKEAQRRRSITILSIASVVAIALASIAFLFFLRSNNSAEMANENLMTATAALLAAEIANEDAILQRNQAQVAGTAEAMALATSEAESTRAFENEGRAQAEEATAVAALQDAKIQRLQGEARTLAANSARLLDGGVNTEALVLAVRAINQTYNAPETCGIVVEEADLALAKALFSLGLPAASLTGHTDDVRSTSFSPDGSRILTASSDTTAKVWQADTGDLLLDLTAHTDDVRSAKFSPDGSRIVTVSDDSTAKVWDTDSGQLLHSLDAHTDWISAATFNSDGSRIITASNDNTTKVWDTDSGQLIYSLDDHPNSVRSVAFSLDGSHIFTGSDNSIAKMWDADSGQLLRSFNAHVGSSMVGDFNPAFNSDGSHIITANSDNKMWNADNIAKVWDVDSGQLIHSLDAHTDWINAATFSPDGSLIVTSSHDTTAKVWDTNSGQLLHSLNAHTGSVLSAAFSPDGSSIITRSSDNTAKLWDADQGQLLRSLDAHTDRIRAATFSPDGNRIIITSTDNTVKVWDVDSAQPQPLRSLDTHTGSVFFATFSPDSNRIVTVSDDTTAMVWDTTSGQLLHSLEDHTDWIHAATFSPDSNRIVTVSDDTIAMVWDTTSGQLLHSLNAHTGSVLSAAFSPDGSRIVTVSWDTTAKVWDTASGQLLHSLDTHPGPVALATFSPDGNRIFTTSILNPTAKEWDADSGQLRRSLNLYAHTGTVWTAVFSPDSSRVVTISADTTAKVWDAHSGQLLRSLDDHTDAVLSVTFSPDGRRIVTGSDDNTAKVWDAYSGQLLSSLDDHTAPVRSVTFNPDGNRIITTSEDTTAKVWVVDTTIPAMLANAELRLARLLSPDEFVAIFDNAVFCTPD